MGYVAVSGGREAIDASLNLQELRRIQSGRVIDTQLVQESLPDLVEQVQSEGSLWCPAIAATAIKQATGSVEEAVFLVRAYRSTLERLYTSRTIDTRTLRADRRISAAFKDIPGGQILGATRDYSHRLIAFDLDDETPESARERQAQIVGELANAAAAFENDSTGKGDAGCLPKVSDYLRSIDLLPTFEIDDAAPADITQTPLSFPAPRSAILQALTRGLTQAVIAIGYAAIRGFGLLHPTVGELRRGAAAITIDAPGNEGASEEDAYYLGSIPVCEVENIIVTDEEDNGVHRSSLDLGYGLVMGSNESKAIAMSVLDSTLRSDDPRYPTQDQEFVLTHIDSVEATGFISHLKLPHYVTFQSKLDSALRSRKQAENAAESKGE
ncbi:MAG: carbon-phosphorus lyase complex subunit PhnI [Eggerthellaceae bacterium]|jgi:alpha-D-ribose 1-methylphosphonate 5-triphosphate synthase subunit PhnI